MIEYAHISCPNCGRELRVRVQYNGLRIACKYCDHSFVADLDHARKTHSAASSPPAPHLTSPSAPAVPDADVASHAELQLLHDQVRELQQAHDAVRLERDRAQAEAKDAREAQTSLQSQLEHALEDADEQRARAVEARRVLEETAEAVERDQTNAESERNALRAELDGAHAAKLDEATRRLREELTRESDSRLEALEKEIAAERAGRAADLDQARHDQETSQEERQRLEQELAEANARHAEISARHAETDAQWESERTRLREEFDREAESRIRDAEARHAEAHAQWESDRTRLREEFDLEAESRIQDVEARHAETHAQWESERARLREEFDREAAARVRDAEARLRDELDQSARSQVETLERKFSQETLRWQSEADALRAEGDRRKTEIEDLQAQLAASDAKRSQTQGRLADLEATRADDRSHWKAESESLTQERDRLREDLAALRTSFDEATADSGRRDALLDDYREREAVWERGDSNRQAVSAEREQLRKRIDELEAALSAANTSHAEQQRSSDEERAIFFAERDQFVAERDEQRREIDSLREEQDRLRREFAGSVASHEKDQARLQSEKDSFGEEQDRLRQELDELRSRWEGAVAEHSRLNTVVTELRSREAEWEQMASGRRSESDETQQLRDQIDELELALKAAAAGFESMDKEIAAERENLVGELNRQRQDAESLRAESTKLRSDLMEAVSRWQAAEDRAQSDQETARDDWEKQYQGRIQELEEQLQAEINRNSQENPEGQLASTSLNWQAEAARLKNEAIQRREELESLRQELEAADPDRERLQAEVAGLRTRLEASLAEQQRLAHLPNELDALQSICARAESERQIARATVEQHRAWLSEAQGKLNRAIEKHRADHARWEAERQALTNGTSETGAVESEQVISADLMRTDLDIRPADAPPDLTEVEVSQVSDVELDDDFWEEQAAQIVGASDASLRRDRHSDDDDASEPVGGSNGSPRRSDPYRDADASTFEETAAVGAADELSRHLRRGHQVKDAFDDAELDPEMAPFTSNPELVGAILDESVADVDLRAATEGKRGKECKQCSADELVPTSFKWYELPLLAVMRPYECKHCLTRQLRWRG